MSHARRRARSPPDVRRTICWSPAWQTYDAAGARALATGRPRSGTGWRRCSASARLYGTVMQLVKIAITIVAVAFTPSEAAEVASSNSLAASIQDKARAMKGTRASPTWRRRGQLLLVRTRRWRVVRERVQHRRRLLLPRVPVQVEQASLHSSLKLHARGLGMLAATSAAVGRSAHVIRRVQARSM
jgi:hypothetical protein